MTSRFYSRATRLYFAAFALLFLALAILGTWRNYTAVPFWDMWHGYLHFYTRAEREGWLAWWDLHNEHRLVLAKSIFWLDLHFLRGSMVLLFTLNVVFSVLNFLCFAWALRQLAPGQWRQQGTVAVLGALAVMAFSWLQAENFTWAFQSQFFLAYLLPLVSFGLLATTRQRSSSGLFALACAAGVLSAGTMANGLLTLPLMVVLALALRLPWRQVLLLAVLAAVVIVMYLMGYQQPQRHGSLLDALRQQPLALADYVLTYLGSLWFYLFGRASHLLAVAGGLLLTGASAWYAWQCWRNRRAAPLELALLAFLLYVGGTAVGTAGGRVLMGVEQALASRYMTPQLMAWSALLVLYVTRYPKVLASGWTVVALALLPLLMLGSQVRAHKHPVHLADHRAAALAAQLDVRDTEYFGRVFYDPSSMSFVSAKARREGLAIFGASDLQAAKALWGQLLPTTPEGSCQGRLSSLERLPDDSAHLRMRGWLMDGPTQAVPTYVMITNGQQRVVGFAVTGAPDDDALRERGQRGRGAGFIGYLQADAATQALTLVGQHPGCRLPIQDMPAPVP